MALVATTQSFTTMVVQRTFLEVKDDSLEEPFYEGRPRAFSDPGCTCELRCQKYSVELCDDDAESLKATTLGSSKDRSPRRAVFDSESASAFSLHESEVEFSAVSAASPPGVLTTVAATSVCTVPGLPHAWSFQDSAFPAVTRQCGAPRTSLILQNIPGGCTRAELQGLLDSHGFYAQYDLLYLPTNFWTWKNCGYAFVNMVSHGMATMMMQRLHGFEGWCAEGVDTLEVSFSHIQGAETHIERYRNSPVMHHTVPDEYKPVLLAAGQAVALPEPTRKIKPPPALKNSLQSLT